MPTSRRDVLAGAASLAAGSVLSQPATGMEDPHPSFSEDQLPMSQYCYTLNVHGGDHDALQAALVHYQQLCEVMVANGHSHPFAFNRLVMSNLLRETSASNAEAVAEFCEASANWPPRRRSAPEA